MEGSLYGHVGVHPHSTLGSCITESLDQTEVNSLLLFVFDRRFGWSERTTASTDATGWDDDASKEELAEIPREHIHLKQRANNLAEEIMNLIGKPPMTTKLLVALEYAVNASFKAVVQVQEVFERFLLIAGNKEEDWRFIEGAIMGIMSIVKKFKRPETEPKSLGKDIVFSDSNEFRREVHEFPTLTWGEEKIETLPSFVTEKIKQVLYTGLTNSQLSVRDVSNKAFASYLGRTSMLESLKILDEVIEKFNSELTFTDYETEAMFGLLNSLVGHSASTVRQACSSLLIDIVVTADVENGARFVLRILEEFVLYFDISLLFEEWINLENSVLEDNIVSCRYCAEIIRTTIMNVHSLQCQLHDRKKINEETALFMSSIVADFHIMVPSLLTSIFNLALKEFNDRLRVLSIEILVLIYSYFGSSLDRVKLDEVDPILLVSNDTARTHVATVIALIEKIQLADLRYLTRIFLACARRLEPLAPRGKVLEDQIDQAIDLGLNSNDIREKANTTIMSDAGTHISANETDDEEEDLDENEDDENWDDWDDESGTNGKEEIRKGVVLSKT
ncbi:unnamed protein product [Sphagnum tenellum]